MTEETNNSETVENSDNDVHRLNVDGKELLLVGTAHISRESAQLVRRIIEDERPDTVCIELDEKRFESLSKRKNWVNLNLKESRVLINRLPQLQSHRQFKGSPQLKTDLNKIFQLYAEKGSIYNRIKISHLLLGFILKVVDLGEVSVENSVSATIDQICRFIHDNIHDDLKLETIAAHGNLSLSHFKYRFKRETGIPPAEYILRQKIEAAKEMLLKNHRVTEVAYGLAFCSSSYFATVFKSYTGITPTQFVRSSKD